MKRIVWISSLAGILVILIACQFCGENKKGRQIALPENDKQIQSGEIYEITDNNFVEGLEHAFSEEELEIWNEVYEEGGLEKKEGTLNDKDIKYMIFLYDSRENEVGQYILDKNGRLFDGSQEGKAVYNQKIMNLIEKIIQ